MAGLAGFYKNLLRIFVTERKKLIVFIFGFITVDAWGFKHVFLKDELGINATFLGGIYSALFLGEFMYLLLEELFGIVLE